MAIGDVFQAEVYLNLDDRRVSVGLFFEETEARAKSAAEFAELLADSVKTSFWTAYLFPLLSDELTYTGNKCQMIHPTRQAPFIKNESSPIPGNLSSEATNGTNAVIVAEYGPTWGPRTRGRMFIPGLPESQISDGRIKATDYSPFQSAADTYYALELEPDGAGQGKVVPCVFSAAKPNAVPPLAALSDFPITAQVRARIGTQRRRRTNVTSPS